MKETNMIYRRTFWVVSCLGALLSSTSLAHAHTRWLVLDSIQTDHQSEGDAEVTNVADNVMDVQPETTEQLEDEFWSEALKNVEVSSALDTDEDIPTLTAEGSFILPTYILPEADERKNVEKTAVADTTNPWRQDGVTMGEHSVIETPTMEAPTLDHVEEQYAQTEDLLAQTSTRLETIEARIRELQELNTQMAEATQAAVDEETERLAATLTEETSTPEESVEEEPAMTQSVEVEISVDEPEPISVAQALPEVVPQVKPQPKVQKQTTVQTTTTTQTQPVVTAQPKVTAQPVVQPQPVAQQPVLIAASDVQAQQDEIRTQKAAIQAKKAEIQARQEENKLNTQKNQIQETKAKIAKLQQTVEYAGLQVAYQDTTALLNNTAKKLKSLENDLAQLKKNEENQQKAKLVEDQYQKTAALLSVTTAQLESVERRMAALDAQEAQIKAEQEAAQVRAEAARIEAARARALAQAAQQTAPAVEEVTTYAEEEPAVLTMEPETTPEAESPIVVAQIPTTMVEISAPVVVAQAPEADVEEESEAQQPTFTETDLPSMKMADATTIQLQNAAEALANATARLEALEARLTAAPQTNLAVAAPSQKKRPWLLPIEAMEEDTEEAAEEVTPIIPTVKNAYVDRVLQAIDRSEKNRDSSTYPDDVMLRTIPNEIKINFQPGRAELSAQALKWVHVFSYSMKHRPQNAIEIRMGMQQLELQARRFALLKAALLSNGVSPRQIRFTLTNRDNDSVVLRVIPLVQDYDLQERDVQSGQKVKQVIYQW